MIHRLQGFCVLVLSAAILAGCSPSATSRTPGGPLPPGGHPDVAGAPFLDPELPLDTRVDDLLGRMTLEEKVSQTLYDAGPVERLGIPAYNWWNEALHGVARAGRATVFPQAIGLAATFDPDLLFDVATAISDEARAKYHESLRGGQRGIYEGLTFWSPNINIFRDPRWGRGMETYGEDPFLAGRLAVEFVRGMQGDDPFYLKTIATPKHFAVHSGPEPDRHTFDAVVDERDLRETYLPAFRASVTEGGAESVMCAYNRFRGDPACSSPLLLQQILRDEWGFQGYVVSDCWAIMDIFNTHRVAETVAQAAAMGVASGTDLNCGVSYDSLGVAIQDGLLTEEQLDVSLRRLLKARFRLGMFDPPGRVPYSTVPFSVNESQEHQALALEATRKSIVLLKNQGGLLPLSGELGTVAVIGPNAHDEGVLLGNYNGIPSDPVTPLRGIREKVSGNTQVIYARGSGLAENLPFLQVVPVALLSPDGGDEGAVGLRGEYFANEEMAGTPMGVRTDGVVDFQWFGEEPIAGLAPDSFSVRWTGSFVPPTSGRYSLGVRALGNLTLHVDEVLVARVQSSHEVNAIWDELELEEGVSYDIRLEFRPVRTGAVAQLVWAQPQPNLLGEAVWAAEQSDAVIMFLGLSPRLEGEEMRVEVPGFSSGDRVDIGLPQAQLDLLEAVVATGKPTVVVLLNGSAVAIPWMAENVPAILEAWYPGQAAGSAIADVLFGDHNPGGRLPLTFYRSVDQLPPFDSYDMAGRTYRYFQGDPVFPFGHGLSYTTFAYSDLQIPEVVADDEDVPMSVTVRNTGAVAGEEVVQLYLTDVEASAPVPIRSLQGVARIFLEPGQEKTVEFTLTPRQLSLIDNDQERVVEPGIFQVSVGGKQPGFTGLADASTTEVIIGRFRVGGRPSMADTLPTLGLEEGFLDLETPFLDLRLVRASQTVAFLQPKGHDGFDFTPGDWLERRAGNNHFHLGDLRLRLREDGAGEWTDYSTAERRQSVEALPTSGPILAAADLAPTLPPGIPLRVKRYWEREDGQLVLRFELENLTDQSVEIGALGIPMVFNNILQGRSLDEAHAQASFHDPYIGLDAGYLQVTRLNGHGPVLLVVPHGATPFEAYNPLLSERTRRGITFEGFYEWMAHSRAYAETEWEDAHPWNPPTSEVLAPGQTRSYGVRFLLADGLREIEPTLAENRRPVAVGTPGYVIPTDLTAHLFLKSPSPVERIQTDPAGALTLEPEGVTPGGWLKYRVQGKRWGRAQVTVHYTDGTRQAIHYKVIEPMAEVASKLGAFLTTDQWFEDPLDPFGRSPSVISFDYDEDRQVREDNRAWIAGLGDEGGSGSWVAAFMKQLIQPDPVEVGKLESFVDGVLWGGLQYDEGDWKYGVRKSMFYYEPDSLPEGTYDESVRYGGWSSWDKEEAMSVGRSFNYPHVAAAHWALYRLARNRESLVTNHPWEWYLERAFQTGEAMVRFAPHYAQFGQMEGTVFLRILEDLKREGWTEQAASFETTMKERADLWRSLGYPFGSEMPWDSTGQEEVYGWTKYFGFIDKAAVTLNAILAYMPTVPHWGYNGSARRYWDFQYAGKLRRVERQLHHYGSGLNAIPVLSEYRDHPEDFYLLRVGYGGLMGAVANITQDGFGPSGFHAYPSALRIDGYSGDYGPGFFGHAVNTGTYVIQHPEFGWLAFGGEISVQEGSIRIRPLDSARMRVFLAPLGLWLTLDSGTFESVEILEDEVRVTLSPATSTTPAGFLRIEQPAFERGEPAWTPTNPPPTERGALRVPLGESPVTLVLRRGG